ELARPRLREAADLIASLASTIPGEGLEGPAIVKSCAQIEAGLAEVVKIAPRAAEGWYLMASAQELRGDLASAVDNLTRALAEDDRYIDALSMRARLRLRMVSATRTALNRPGFAVDAPAEADQRA